MGPTKGGSSKGSVSSARVGRTHKDMGTASGKGSGANRRDSATNTSKVGGDTLRYRSGDVKRSSTTMAKYK